MLSKFSVGQVWKYKTRQNETASRITIVHIDSGDPEYGNIIHIFISGVSIPNPKAPEGETIYIGHMPYDEEALGKSVTEMESETKDLPDYEDGYRLWKKSFESSEAGVFEIPVLEAIDFVEQSISNA